MPRYFAPIINQQVILNANDIHHLLHVMRLRVHDKIEVVDQGKVFWCQIDSLSPLYISVIKQLDEDREFSYPVTLLFPLAKSDKIEFVLQKATELGVRRIVLIRTNRCVVKFDDADFMRKKTRYEKIIEEAAEQSCRLVLPTLEGVYDINHLPIDVLSSANYVAYEKLSDIDRPFSTLKDKSSVSFLVGPEGGLTEEEIDSLKKQGFASISLGKRILRCETAAIYGLSVLGYWLEK
ncbi:MAG: RsmE family RNA methyltransferase [Bacilli bacterium]